MNTSVDKTEAKAAECGQLGACAADSWCRAPGLSDVKSEGASALDSLELLKKANDKKLFRLCKTEVRACVYVRVRICVCMCCVRVSV